ncbi:MAG: WGR domain-containing protein [Methylococcales bacterium]
MTRDGFRIDLQACDPARNRQRFYTIEAAHDLFGDLIVTLHYGRIGTRGHTKNFIVPDAQAGAKLVRACLKRRQSAPKRVGVAYEVLAKFDPDNWADF